LVEIQPRILVSNRRDPFPADHVDFHHPFLCSLEIKGRFVRQGAQPFVELSGFVVLYALDESFCPFDEL
jgi:hypothetical protein